MLSADRCGTRAGKPPCLWCHPRKQCHQPVTSGSNNSGRCSRKAMLAAEVVTLRHAGMDVIHSDVNSCDGGGCACREGRKHAPLSPLQQSIRFFRHNSPPSTVRAVVYAPGGLDVSMSLAVSMPSCTTPFTVHIVGLVVVGTTAPTSHTERVLAWDQLELAPRRWPQLKKTGGGDAKAPRTEVLVLETDRSEGSGACLPGLALRVLRYADDGGLVPETTLGEVKTRAEWCWCQQSVFAARN